MRFEKWQALGNDYLIVEREKLPFELTPARVRRLCESHFGVGADGVLLLSPPAGPAHVADLRIFNPDGSEAELSGNGAREAILYLRRRGWTERDEFTIHTMAGEIHPQITGADTCRVDMGRASVTSKDFPGGAADGRGEVSSGGRSWAFQHVSIGNPQCAIRMDSVAELEALDLPALGPAIEADAQFSNRSNVSWYASIEEDPRVRAHARAGTASGEASGGEASGGNGKGNGSGVAPADVIRARIFERGVGETLSSGTGATGAAVAHLLAGDPPARPASVTVVLDGGELTVEVDLDLRVNLTGWARPVYAGELSEDFVKELHETE
jgi:diaminopimelate epimerase